jgi:hypothetical protein
MSGRPAIAAGLLSMAAGNTTISRCEPVLRSVRLPAARSIQDALQPQWQA